MAALIRRHEQIAEAPATGFGDDFAGHLPLVFPILRFRDHYVAGEFLCRRDQFGFFRPERKVCHYGLID